LLGFLEISFKEVCDAMQFVNIGSGLVEEVEKFIKDHELDKIPHIFMADHSFAPRQWNIKDGQKPLYFEEIGSNGGWFVFKEEDVEYLYCESVSSGSSITAWQERDKSWTMVLEDEQIYKGEYWESFHSAIGCAIDPE
jgi:hypothetical protein